MLSINRVVGVLLFLTAIIAPNAGKSQTHTVGVFKNDSNAFAGYNLICPMGATKVYLIDNCGRKVNEWTTQEPNFLAYLQDNGDLVHVGVDSLNFFNFGGKAGVITRYSWSGNTLWKYRMSHMNAVQHHDIEVLPNGNILAMMWRQLSDNEKRNTGRDTFMDPLEVPLWEEVIVELEPKGTNSADTVWKWHMTDHLVQSFNPQLSNFGNPSSHPELLNINYNITGAGLSSDWLHLNSIDYNPMLDQIVVSSFSNSEIYIIDHSTTIDEAAKHSGGNMGKGGDLLFRWGHPAAYGKTRSQHSFNQHDAQWITQGPHTGNLMFFNNGGTRGYSSVEIIQPVFNGANYAQFSDGCFIPDSSVISFTKPSPTDLHSQFMSSADFLANGNLLVTESMKGKISELTLDSGKVVWEYINPVSSAGIITQGNTPSNNFCFKSHRYEPSHGAFTGQDLTPGSTIEANPWPGFCAEPEDTTVNDTTINDTTIQDTSKAHILFAESGANITMYPNPSTGRVKLHFNQPLSSAAIRVQNAAGLTVHVSEVSNSIDCDLQLDLPPGWYTVHVNAAKLHVVMRLVIM